MSRSISAAVMPDFSIAFITARCCNALSACSQVSLPNVPSAMTSSKHPPRGPSPSLLPTIAADAIIPGRLLNFSVYFPILSVIRSPRNFLCDIIYHAVDCRRRAAVDYNRARNLEHISARAQNSALCLCQDRTHIFFAFLELYDSGQR